MIIAGWKKGAREIAYLGISKCHNCRNYDHFGLYEVATKATLYFIPIAKLKRQYIMTCNLCNAAWEVDSTKREEILRESAAIPSRQYVTELWNEIDREFLSSIEAARSSGELGAQDLAGVIKGFGDRMTRRHPSPQAGYVVGRYLESMVDPDRPE